MYDEECIQFAKSLGKPGLISIKPKMDEFVFKVEGTGVLPVKDIIQQALDILREKYQNTWTFI